MAFPFLLCSSLLWLKRDLPGEITHKQICARLQCGDTAFEEKTSLLTNTHYPLPLPHCTIVICFVAGGQQTSPSLTVFHFFASFLLSIQLVSLLTTWLIFLTLSPSFILLHRSFTHFCCSFFTSALSYCGDRVVGLSPSEMLSSVSSVFTQALVSN